MTITQATRDEFKALLLGALADNEVAVAFGRAAIGNRYGDQDGDGKADTAGQIIGINSRKLDQLAGKLDQLAGKLDQLAAGK